MLEIVVADGIGVKTKRRSQAVQPQRRRTMVPGNVGNNERPERVSDDDMPLDLAIADDPDLRLRIGRYLGGIRKLKKLSQEEAAAALNMSRPHLSNIEQGRSRTGWKGLRTMAAYYGYGIKALIDEVTASNIPEVQPAVEDEKAQMYSEWPPRGRSTTTDDEDFVLGLWRLLDKSDRQAIVRQMLLAAEERAGKIGKS